MSEHQDIRRLIVDKCRILFPDEVDMQVIISLHRRGDESTYNSMVIGDTRKTLAKCQGKTAEEALQNLLDATTVATTNVGF